MHADRSRHGSWNSFIHFISWWIIGVQPAIVWHKRNVNTNKSVMVIKYNWNILRDDVFLFWLRLFQRIVYAAMQDVTQGVGITHWSLRKVILYTYMCLVHTYVWQKINRGLPGIVKACHGWIWLFPSSCLVLQGNKNQSYLNYKTSTLDYSAIVMQKGIRGHFPINGM